MGGKSLDTKTIMEIEAAMDTKLKSHEDQATLRINESTLRPPNNQENNPSELVKGVHELGMVKAIVTDQKLQKKLEKQSKRSVSNEIENIAADSKKQREIHEYDVNAEACRIYCVDTSVPAWQQKMMAFGAGIWFVIYFFIASVSIAPVNTLLGKIQVFIKQNWLALIFAIMVYLGIAAPIIYTIIMRMIP